VRDADIYFHATNKQFWVAINIFNSLYSFKFTFTNLQHAGSENGFLDNAMQPSFKICFNFFVFCNTNFLQSKVIILRSTPPPPTWRTWSLYLLPLQVPQLYNPGTGLLIHRLPQFRGYSGVILTCLYEESIYDINDWLKNTTTYFSTSKEKLFLLVKSNKLKKQNKLMWPVLDCNRLHNNQITDTHALLKCLRTSMGKT
jgi:hypothetical protein